MQQYVVLLRGVNVGRAKRVPMIVFRELLSRLGYTNARTVLNSGNAVVVSESRASAVTQARRIRSALIKELDVDVEVVVKSEEQMAAVASERAIATSAGDDSKLLVVFTNRPENLQEVCALLPRVKPPEKLQVGDHALYLYCANGILESAAALALLKNAPQATTRNWATVMKILVNLNG